LRVEACGGGIRPSFHVHGQEVNKVNRIAKFDIVVMTCVCLGCSAATAPSATSGHDSFGQSALDSYNHYSDNGNPWIVSPDTLKAEGVGVQSVLIRKNRNFSNGWVEIETKQVDDGGLVLRFLDNEHYYLLAVRDDAAPQPRDQENFEIYERTGSGPGGFAVIWLKDIVWPRGTVHRIRFEAEADTLSVFVDGTSIGSVKRPPAFDGSGFGIRHYGLTADWHDRFRNFNWQGS
jgi:hypothetical protein